jgi:hypothetical protein
MKTQKCDALTEVVFSKPAVHAARNMHPIYPAGYASRWILPLLEQFLTLILVPGS